MPPMANLGKEMKGASAKKEEEGKAEEEQDPAELARQRAVEEAQYLRRLADITRKQLREKLGEERRLTQMNRAKVEASWIKIMRMAKVDQLRRDVEVMAQTHEREVDRKDGLLQALDRDLDEAEEQYQSSVRSHLHALDRFVQLQDERLSDLERAFEQDLAELEAEFDDERVMLEEAHREEVHAMRALIEVMEEQEEDKRAHAKQAYETNREELRNATVERIEELARTSDERILQLERALENEHAAYLQNTDTTAEKFKEMTAKDKRTQDEIRDRTREIRKLQQQLLAARARMKASARGYKERNDALVREKDHMGAHVGALKRRMQRAREQEARRFHALSETARASKQTLADRTDTAEQVIRLMERCRQMESEHEKVVPFYQSNEAGGDTRQPRAYEDSATGAVVAASRGTAAQGDASDAAERAVEVIRQVVDGGEADALENFYKKYNKVLLDKLSLESEQSHLAQENQQIREVLQQMLGNMTVSADTVDAPNPLLVVNGRTGASGSGSASPLPVRATRAGRQTQAAAPLSTAAHGTRRQQG